MIPLSSKEKNTFIQQRKKKGTCDTFIQQRQKGDSNVWSHSIIWTFYCGYGTYSIDIIKCDVGIIIYDVGTIQCDIGII